MAHNTCKSMGAVLCVVRRHCLKYVMVTSGISKNR